MLKEFIGRLKVANDVITLDDADLEAKYLASEEAYSDFLSKFATFYDNNLLYQLRMADENPKIKSIISKGNNKYPNRDNDIYYEKLIGGMTHVEEKFKVQYGGKDIGEAICLLRDGVGIQYVEGDNFDYQDIAQKIYEAGKKYIECSNDSISDFVIKAYYAINNEELAKDGLKKFAEEYMEEHPMTSLCNDPNFLYFVNYMTYYNRSDIDANFYESVEDIIKGSEVLQHIGSGKNKVADKKYMKLAKYTLSEIARFKKRQEVKNKERIAKLKKALK